jgi:hypothetical protein
LYCFVFETSSNTNSSKIPEKKEVTEGKKEQERKEEKGR